MGEPISVVVPTRDRPALLEACLAALAAALGPDDQLIVADSASTRPVSLGPQVGGRAEVVRCELPGASRARNAGWRRARHQLVAFVDDDIRVTPGWADAIRACAAAHPEAAFFTGRVSVPPSGPPVSRPVAVLDRDEPAVIDAASTGSLGHGANLVVRRAALEAVGGFDERLGPGTRLHAAEDYDLFDRLLARGMTGRYEPSVSVHHEQWRDRRALLRLDWSYGIGGGARLVKLARTDRARARRAATVAFWTWGLRPAIRDLAAGYQFGFAYAMARVAGTVVGLARGARLAAESPGSC